ncbi:MAG: NAD(P)-dependent oxidoreductase [Balneolaceae bacterium]
MNAFITGATGFIGSHLADKLIEDPEWDQVKCLVRNKEKWLEGKEYTRIEGDLHSIKSIQKALKDVDVIFHIAGIVKAPDQKQFDHANVDATENIIKLAKKTGVNKLVILSSLAAAGPSNGNPRTEDEPFAPVSMYGISKMRMEKMIASEVGDDLSVTILRPPAVYGPREEQIFTLFKMMNNGIAPLIGDGENPKVSLIFVDDLIQAIVKAAKQSDKGVHTYFVSDGNIVNWNRIKNIVTTVLGKKSVTISIRPDWVKKIAGVIETTASFFGIYPVINREKANEMVLEWTCSSQKAINELNFEPQFTLEEGISRTIRWYKIHKWL